MQLGMGFMPVQLLILQSGSTIAPAGVTLVDEWVVQQSIVKAITADEYGNWHFGVYYL